MPVTLFGIAFGARSASMLAASILCLGSFTAQFGHAQSAPAIVERGEGPALVFIPGLNSGSDTFTATCEAFVATHHCILLHLPGFAGHPPGEPGDTYLLPTRDAVIELLQANAVTNATVVGHSLGGVLAMMIGLQAPELVQRLVLIDALPFYPAIQNPALTADLMKPQVEQMRMQMSGQSDEVFFRAAMQSSAGMTRSPERQVLLNEWTTTSDRVTTTAAMLDMLATDLRAAIGGLKQPILVLGSWAAYEPYGSTQDSTRAIFAGQYAAAPAVDIRMSEAGYHFLTWDDGEWVNAQIRQFIGE